MSEYQYYEFQAIDRRLDAADRQALRDLSTRAKITATSFTNTYHWGSFKGDPAAMMLRWFDLHLYTSNWGTRVVMIAFPRRLIDEDRIRRLIAANDCAEIATNDDRLVLSITCEEMVLEPDWYNGDEDEEDGDSGWLNAIAPLRADMLGGDLRLLYLIWLMAVGFDIVEADEPEPMPGLGPVTDALAAFANFFEIDSDLVAAAAELGSASAAPPAAEEVAALFGPLPAAEKDALLARVATGDPHVAAELQSLVRQRMSIASPPSGPGPRTAGTLRARAAALCEAREREAAAAEAARQKREAEEAARIRHLHLVALIKRGDAVWHEIEEEIGRRNGPGYARAVELIGDMRAIAGERDAMPAFDRRLAAIRERHAQKGRFIERIDAAGLRGGG